MNKLTNTIKQALMHISYKLHPLLDPHPMNGPTKSPLSVCQFGVFLRNGSLVFTDFRPDGR